MRKYVLLVLAVLLIGGCSNTSAPSEGGNSSALQTFNVGYLPTTGHSLYFIAKEEGFFEEEGLDVELRSFSNSGEGINAIAAGKLDAGTFGTAAPLSFLEKGADFVFFGGHMGTGAGVVAKPEIAEKLKTPADFKGKKVATVQLATGDVVWRGALAEAGLDWKQDVEINEMHSPADVILAVKKGEVDAGVVWVPFVEKAKQEGLEIISYTNEYQENHVCGRLIAPTDKFSEDNKQYVAFLKAMIKAERFEHAEENREKAVQAVAKYVQIDHDIIEKDLYSGYLDQTVDPNKNAILAFQDTMVDIGYLKESQDLSDRIYTEAYVEALKELTEESPNDEYYQKLEKRFEENNQ